MDDISSRLMASTLHMKSKSRLMRMICFQSSSLFSRLFAAFHAHFSLRQESIRMIRRLAFSKGALYTQASSTGVLWSFLWAFSIVCFTDGLYVCDSNVRYHANCFSTLGTRTESKIPHRMFIN